MTITYTPANVGSLTQNPTTAQTSINNNFASISTAFDSALNTSGDQMQGVLDMNSNQVINLPDPATSNSPLRLQDLSTFTGAGTVTNIPTGGSTGQVLTKTSNSNFAVNWSSQAAGLQAGTNISITGSSPATVAVIPNPVFSTSVTTPELINTGTLTLPTSTDTLVGRATTDTLTNKTVTSAGNTITLGSNAVSTSTGSGSLVYGTSPTLVTPSFPSIINTGTVTLPTSTDTLVGRGTTDTLTNKTINGSNNTLTVLGASQISGNIPVTNLNGGTSAGSTTFWRGDGSWSAPTSGSYIFLETLTASNSASLSTSQSWSGYSAIEFLFENIAAASAAVNLLLQVNSSGVQSTGYVTSSFGVAGSTTITEASPTTGVIMNHGNGIAATSTGLSGTVRLHNPASTTTPKIISGHTAFITSAVCATAVIGGWWGGGNGAITGVQFSMSSGNISTGSIRVYGII